jgi:hypothetical protein
VFFYTVLRLFNSIIVTEYSVCGSRARLSHVTPEYATYASSPTSLHRESEQLQNLLSESPYLLRDNYVFR